jgi:hypothetical protein
MNTTVLSGIVDFFRKIVTTTYKTETKDSHVIMPYGLQYWPSVECPAVMIGHNVDSQSSSVLIENPQDIAPLKKGSLVIGHPETKSCIIFYPDKSIKVISNSTTIVESLGNVTVTAPVVNLTAATVNVSGVLNVTGAIACASTISDSAGSLSALRSVYNTHTHVHDGTNTSGPSATA